MSQNINDRRKKWPKETDSFKVGSKTVDSKKEWEPPSDYDKGGKYTKVKAWTFRSGHSIEVDDTPGGERLRVYHTNGSYIDMQADGTNIYRAEKDDFEVVQGNKSLRVKGATHVHISGDADIKVDGNADVEVGGNSKWTIGGTWEVKANFINFKTPFFLTEGAKMGHNDKDVGWTHEHIEVMPGPGISGVPTPL